MTLAAGTRLGFYEVLAKIGAGGMGEVYQAHDTKLGRDVAIKVLPANFVNDPERQSRFQREARMLAALNHANIATIYGMERSGWPALPYAQAHRTGTGRPDANQRRAELV